MQYLDIKSTKWISCCCRSWNVKWTISGGGEADQWTVLKYSCETQNLVIVAAVSSSYYSVFAKICWKWLKILLIARGTVMSDREHQKWLMKPLCDDAEAVVVQSGLCHIATWWLQRHCVTRGKVMKKLLHDKWTVLASLTVGFTISNMQHNCV